MALVLKLSTYSPLLPPTHTHICTHTHTHTLQKANEFRNAVFNDTVNIVEVEEGFDGET